MAKNRLEEGLVFKKLDAKGKVFIEYLPAEYAWVPISAAGYTCVNCFWVSGRFKGQGYGAQLLDACIQDSKEKGKHGIVVISSNKSVRIYQIVTILRKRVSSMRYGTALF